MDIIKKMKSSCERYPKDSLGFIVYNSKTMIGPHVTHQAGRWLKHSKIKVCSDHEIIKLIMDTIDNKKEDGDIELYNVEIPEFEYLGVQLKNMYADKMIIRKRFKPY